MRSQKDRDERGENVSIAEPFCVSIMSTAADGVVQSEKYELLYSVYSYGASKRTSWGFNNFEGVRVNSLLYNMRKTIRMKNSIAS